MRTTNSIRNIIITFGGQILNLLLSFICRSVFVRMLTDDYLGINGLFTNLLSILSLAELGFGSAIIYSMYKPLAENNEKKIKALMNLYKRAYTVIGIVIAVLSLALLPFLDVLTKGKGNVEHLTLIYLLYVLNTVITYFYAYKRSIIIANQQMYIVTLYQYALTFIQILVQIILLLITRNFILYLVTQIVFNFLINLFISRKADQMYPYLKEKNDEKLDEATKSSIFRNIKAMFLHRAGDVVVNNTDNIIMSIFTGVRNVGYYSNYKMILNAISGILNQVFNSITASIGNLGAMESDEKIHDTYLAINFIGFWIFGFCSICFFVLLNPFMKLWMGEQRLFRTSIILLLSINFYITGMRRATLIFRDAMGLFWYDRYKAVVECIVNLIASLILVKVMGITGIFMGTFISSISVSAWVEPYILYKYGLKRSGKEFASRYLIYTAAMVLAGAVTWFLSEQLAGAGIMGFLIRLVFCAIVPNFVFFILFARTKEFSYFWRIFLQIVGKFRKKE